MRTDGVTTPTRVESGSRCHRRHLLSNIAEKGKYKSAAAAFGTCLHAGTAEWWRSSDPAKVLEAGSAEWRAQQSTMNEKHSLELLTAMLTKYTMNAKLGGPFDEQFQVVTIEERLPVTFEGVSLNFQLDRLLSIDNQRLVLVDTKSASRLDARWRSQWDRSLQQKLYMAAVQKLYDMPCQVVMEGVSKTAKADIEYYICPEWTDAQLDEAVNQARWIQKKDKAYLDILTLEGEQAMLEAMLNQSEFNPEDCFSYNVECPFLPLCNADPMQRLGLLLADYQDMPGDF